MKKTYSRSVATHVMAPGFGDEARRRAREKVQRRIAEHDAKVWPRIRKLLGAGLSCNAVSRVMTVDGYPSPAAFLTEMPTGWTRLAVAKIRDRNMRTRSGDTEDVEEVSG